MTTNWEKIVTLVLTGATVAVSQNSMLGMPADESAHGPMAMMLVYMFAMGGFVDTMNSVSSRERSPLFRLLTMVFCGAVGAVTTYYLCLWDAAHNTIYGAIFVWVTLGLMILGIFGACLKLQTQPKPTTAN